MLTVAGTIECYAIVRVIKTYRGEIALPGI